MSHPKGRQLHSVSAVHEIMNLFSKNPNKSEKEKLKDRCSHVIIFVRVQALAQHLTLTQMKRTNERTKLKQFAESRRKKQTHIKKKPTKISHQTIASR